MDVEWNDSELNVITTYDDLIQEYVGINQSIRNDVIDKNHAEYIKSVFVNNSSNQVLSTEVEEDIEALVATLNKEFKIVQATAKELNEYIGAENLNILNSVVTSQKVNIKLYILLALVFFLFFGCVGAVVIGRFKDFIEYIIYTDKKTKLPNRQMCDVYIDSLSDKKLDEHYSCIIIKLNNLFEVNDKLGRSAGDTVLADLGRIIKSLAKNYGFIGYNSIGQFLGIFEQCTVSKAELFITQLEKSVKEYNEKHIEINIKYSVSLSNSTEDGIHDIRALIRRAFEKM